MRRDNGPLRTMTQISSWRCRMDEEVRETEEIRQDEWFDVMREWFEDK